MKRGQTWHRLARAALEGTERIRPKDLGYKLGESPQKAAAILRSLGWTRKRIDKYTILYIRR